MADIMPGISEAFNIVVDKDFSRAELYYDLSDNITINANNIHFAAACLMDMLYRQNIYAVNEKNISAVISDIKNNSNNGGPVLAAESILPQDGNDARIEWLTGPYAEKGKKDDAGKVNIRDISNLCVVVSGQVLCVKHHAAPGIPGRKINNEAIPCKPGNDVRFKCNSGLSAEEYKDKTVYKAAIDGYLVTGKESAMILETLVINSDIDYSTGNIHYIKDISIKGNVLSGFTVETEGDIIVEGYVENGSVLKAKGNITVYQGIIGEKTRVSAGKNITALYVHHAGLHCDGNIIVKKFVLDASLFAGEQIEVFGEDLKKETSAVIGSTLSSDGKIMVNSAGSFMAAKTVMKLCDIAGRVKNEFEKVKDYQRHLVQVVKKINVKLKKVVVAEVAHAVVKVK